MSDGKPRRWGFVFGVPCLVAGAIGIFVPAEVPKVVGYTFSIPGILLMLGGVIVARGSADPEGDEQDSFVYTPLVLTSYVYGGAAIVSLVVAVYLFYMTQTPYVYPTGAYVAFLFFLYKGTFRYWENCFTVYTVNEKRVVRNRTLLGRKKKKIAASSVESGDFEQSPLERIFNLGGIRIRGANTTLRLRDLRDAKEAKAQLDDLLE